MKSQDLIEKMAKFSYESMKWCQDESENSILLVNEVLTAIVNDATRVSAISEETLDAIDSLREVINMLGKDKNRANANDLAKAINEVAAENSEVNEFVAPMLEALQFQDRVTQNMGNLSKMVQKYIPDSGGQCTSMILSV